MGEETMGSLYRRGKMWWSQVYVNGVAVRESCKTKDRSEAKRVLAEREAQAVRGHRAPSGKTTWAEAVAALLAHYQAYWTRNPREASFRLKHLGRYFHGYRLADIDSAAVTRYVAKRKGQGAAAATINVELATLNRALKLAQEQGKLTVLPVIRRLKPAAPRVGFIERGELEAICRALPEDLQLVVRIGWTFGWRISGEVLPLTKAMVNFGEGTLRLAPGSTKNEERGREACLSHRGASDGYRGPTDAGEEP